MDKTKLIVIQGPTAAGKSALAMELSERFGGEIISADSMQVYRYMDIGTAKPSLEDRKRVRHHLIDIIAPDEGYTAARYCIDAAAAVVEISGRKKIPIVAGGTGLYIKALTGGLFEGPGADAGIRDRLLTEAREAGAIVLHQRLNAVDPEAGATIHPNNVRRVIRALEVYLTYKRPISELQNEHGFNETPYDALKICLTKERSELYSAIDSRVDAMIEAGFVAEVRGLHEAGYSFDLKSMRGLGYKEMGLFLSGASGFAEAVGLLKRNTRHYAKRQLTWFKKDRGCPPTPERGNDKWFYPGMKSDIMALVKGHLNI